MDCFSEPQYAAPRIMSPQTTQLVSSSERDTPFQILISETSLRGGSFLVGVGGGKEAGLLDKISEIQLKSQFVYRDQNLEGCSWICALKAPASGRPVYILISTPCKIPLIRRVFQGQSLAVGPRSSKWLP